VRAGDGILESESVHSSNLKAATNFGNLVHLCKVEGARNHPFSAPSLTTQPPGFSDFVGMIQ